MEPRTGRGMHHTQKYVSPRDQATAYKIEHNDTDFWIWVHGQLVATARFPAENGRDPGLDFTCTKAAEVIEGFYKGDAHGALGPDFSHHVNANEAVWRVALSKAKDNA